MKPPKYMSVYSKVEKEYFKSLADQVRAKREVATPKKEINDVNTISA